MACNRSTKIKKISYTQAKLIYEIISIDTVSHMLWHQIMLRDDLGQYCFVQRNTLGLLVYNLLRDRFCRCIPIDPRCPIHRNTNRSTSWFLPKHSGQTVHCVPR